MSTYNGTNLKLNTGAEIPAIGFGTWQDKDAQEQAVLEALKAGYRHIDTARIYGTEPAVAAAIKKSGIPREELFITSKLWNHKHHPEDVEAALDESLKDLETDYLDMYLIHWPVAFQRGDKPFPKENDKVVTADIDYVDTYKALEKVYKKGKARAIGVSNFNQAEMERLLKETSVVPASHQLELHPYLQQKAFVDWHKKHNILITQYSPFGNLNPSYDAKGVGSLADDPVLTEIAKKHGKTSTQVALAWGIAKGHSVIPKSKTPARIQENFAGDFKLPAEDVARIDAEVDKKARFNNPTTFGRPFYQDLDGA